MFLLAIFVIFPTLLLSACGQKEKSINMSRYFSSAVSYTLYGSSGTQTTELKHFINGKADKQNKYLAITFTGNNAWIYKLTVEKISFDVYSNIDTELQFNIRISNLRNGDEDEYRDPKFRTAIDVKAGKTTNVTIDVNDYFESNTASTTIVIELDGAQHYVANTNGDGLQDTGLQIDIINFAVFGQHNIE